jgi:hypothetical protein
MPERSADSRSGGSSGSKHLPWDADWISPIRQHCRKNPDFRSEFPSGKVAPILPDELGYLPIDNRGADLLFQVVAARYESGSIVITTP